MRSGGGGWGYPDTRSSVGGDASVGEGLSQYYGCTHPHPSLPQRTIISTTQSICWQNLALGATCTYQKFVLNMMYHDAPIDFYPVQPCT